MEEIMEEILREVFQIWYLIGAALVDRKSVV